MSEEQKKRLEEKLRRLDNTPDKPCRWLKKRLNYGTFWTMGFFIGFRVGLGMK